MGTYTSQSLYAIINFRGVTLLFIPAIWKLKIPPRIHVFLWLLSHNKIMTIENLLKRGISKPEACLLSSDNESVNHLFFDCVVAKRMWSYVECFFGYTIYNYESLASKWLTGKTSDCLNISAGVLWGLWLTRNDMVFRGNPWQDIKMVLRGPGDACQLEN
jgi:hypothetical protein